MASAPLRRATPLRQAAGERVQPMVFSSLFPPPAVETPVPAVPKGGRRIRGVAPIPPPVLDAARPVSGHPRRQLIPIAVAAGLTLPAIVTRLSGSAPPEWLAAVIFGVRIVRPPLPPPRAPHAPPPPPPPR